MMKANFVENWCIGSGGTGTFLSFTISDVKEVFWIIYLCIQIFVLALGITIKFIKYYSNDGKIDKEEAQDLTNDANKIENKISDVINKEDKK